MLNPYDVFSVKRNGTYMWIGDGDSMASLWKLIEAGKPHPQDQFVIYDRTTGNVTKVAAGQFQKAV